MNEHKGVQIGAAMRRCVAKLLHSTGDGRSLEQIVDVALKAWLATTAAAHPEAAAAATRGYQWKSLFLPEGCLLRIAVGGQYTVATVCGDCIMYQGRPCSPRQFVMQVTGQVRNAWLALWIRCPGDARWHLADTRRRILRRSPSPARAAAPSPSPSTSISTSTSTSTSPSSSSQVLPQHLVLLAHRRQAYLRRDDCVQDEQADLSIRIPPGRGAGPYGAGRSGPRDRRILGSLCFPGWPLPQCEAWPGTMSASIPASP